jgi:hypothetical protein
MGHSTRSRRLGRIGSSLGCEVRVALHLISAVMNGTCMSCGCVCAARVFVFESTAINGVITIVITITYVSLVPMMGEEHGPWRDSFSAVADIELLSHADVLIGSSDGNGNFLSSFSMLIASLVVSNGRTNVPESDRLRWLPTCTKHQFGSYIDPTQFMGDFSARTRGGPDGRDGGHPPKVGVGRRGLASIDPHQQELNPPPPAPRPPLNATEVEWLCAKVSVPPNCPFNYGPRPP